MDVHRRIFSLDILKYDVTNAALIVQDRHLLIDVSAAKLILFVRVSRGYNSSSSSSLGPKTAAPEDCAALFACCSVVALPRTSPRALGNPTLRSCAKASTLARCFFMGLPNVDSVAMDALSRFETPAACAVKEVVSVGVVSLVGSADGDFMLAGSAECCLLSYFQLC